MVETYHQQIKILSKCFIKPKYEVEASKQPHYLTPIDYLFLSLDHMQKGLLFHAKPQNIQSQLLDKLKISLSHALVYFYPLAGQLATQKFHDEHAMWVYVDCTTGPGARLIHAVVDFSVSDLLSSCDIHPVVPSLFDLGEKAVNYDGHTRPLLSVQVTELKKDGVFIGFTMNHCLADGTSLWHFISTLSEIFLQLKDENHSDNNLTRTEGTNFQSVSSKDITVSRKPIYKPYFPEGYGPIIKLPYLEPDEFVSRFDPGILREKMFHFSSKAMSMLKAKANEECENINDHNVTISSFQALSAFIWTSITRVRNLEPSIKTICSFSLNWRARIMPPFSQECFGNYIEGVQCGSKVGDLLGLGLGSAALLIRQSVEAIDDVEIRKRLHNLAKAPFVAQKGSKSAYYETNGVLIAGSAKFDMYGPEFGLGKAVAVLAGYANKDDGKVTLNPGREGGGSVDVEICLKLETMDALESDEEFMSFVSTI